MFSQEMYGYGAQSSVIREIFSYGLKRKAEIGAENVFDFSLGNPSVEPPAEVTESFIRPLCNSLHTREFLYDMRCRRST